MNRTIIFAIALFPLSVTRSASAAEMTLVRNSRPVTESEIAGGAPSDGMVHDFHATSDADLLCLATTFDQYVYRHPYGSDNAAPDSELIAKFPAIAADSFIQLPSSTFILGGGFDGKPSEKGWCDLNDDGPQKNFLFGRLTTTAPGSFAGNFALRGQETYVSMPFNFTLPGPSGPLSETLSVFGSELSGPDGGAKTPAEPNESIPEAPVPRVDPFVYSPFSKMPVSVELTRRTRSVTSEEIAAGAPDGYVHEFFVTSSTDIIGIRDVALDVPVYQDKFGLDSRAPGASRLDLSSSVSADSFLDTPSQTYMEGGFASASEGNASWYDRNNSGPQDEFLFARLTVDDTGNFSGGMNVAGPDGPVELRFNFVLPGSADDLGLIDKESKFSLVDPNNPAADSLADSSISQIPEPSAIILATLAAAAMRSQRRSALRFPGHLQHRIV